MAVVEMQKISISAHRSNRKAILETLQKLEVIQVVEADLDETGLRHKNTADARATFEKNADLADQALAILDKYVPEKQGMLSGLAGKELIDDASFDKVVESQQDCMAVARKIVRNEKEISECSGNILKNENQKESLVPWMNLDVPMSFTGTDKTAAFIGSVQGVCDEAQVYALIKEKTEGIEELSVTVLSSESDMTNIFVLCLKEAREKVESALRSLGFAKPPQAVLGVPKKVAEDLDRDTEKQKTEIERLKKGIEEYAGSREDLRVVSDYYRTRAEKYRLLGTIPQTRKAFFIEGWVPKESAEAVAKLLTEKYGAVVDYEEKKEGETEPTLLRNNKFSRNYEPVLASYGLPQHGKVDPTTIMSFFYMFFFGMMLSDAGYGLLMVIGCGIALLKFPRMAQGMKKMITMFFWCGVRRCDRRGRQDFLRVYRGQDREAALVRSADIAHEASHLVHAVRYYPPVLRSWNQGISVSEGWGYRRVRERYHCVVRIPDRPYPDASADRSVREYRADAF